MFHRESVVSVSKDIMLVHKENIVEVMLMVHRRDMIHVYMVKVIIVNHMKELVTDYMKDEKVMKVYMMEDDLVMVETIQSGES